MNTIDLTKRASQEALLYDFEVFKNESFFLNFIKDLPGLVVIINEQRQIIFANQSILDFLGIDESVQLLGARFGEIICCENASLESTGCGTSNFCRFCGILETISESQNTNKKVSKEISLIRTLNGVKESLDFLVSCSPLKIPRISCWILHFEDRSEKERKSSLESIFFHDILNTAGLLKGLSDLILKLDNGNQTTSKYLRIMNDLTKKLMDEIDSQKILLQAENGNLRLKINSINSLDIIEESVSYLAFHNDLETQKILIDDVSINYPFQTDLSLLRRVLINMLKNAIEASGCKESILIGCKKENESIIFFVKNKSFIPIENQGEIFKRLFSTKAKSGRGLGTYSMKLLTEQYLSGCTSFISTEKEGTTFFIQIPISIN